MTSFYSKSMGDIVKNHEKELREVLGEIISLANKKGINLTIKNLEDAVMLAKTKIPYDSKTSMQLDFQEKQKL